MYEFEATANVLVMTGQGKASIDRRHLEVAPAAAAAPAIASSDSPESTESFIVRSVLAGDRDMFGRLYELYAPLVHGVLLARMPRSEVEDVV